jgi:O-antigen/teichoic acid export membrane protein
MLLRQTLLYLPAQIIGPLAQFLSVILWTYFLSPHEMGAFALITAAQELAYTAAVFWFTLYTVRYFDKSATEEDKKKFLDTERGVLLAAGVVTALGMLAMPLFVASDWTMNLASAAVAYSILRSTATHLADRARTTADAVTYSILQVFWSVAGLGLGLLFVEIFSPTAATVLWGYAAAQIVTFALASPRLEFGKVVRISRPMIRAASHYALPLVIGGIFVWFANNGIRFIIERSEGMAAVGLVTVGWGLGIRAATSAAMLVTAAAFPLAVTKSREHGIARGQRQLVENGILLLAALAPATAGLWAISGPFVGLLVAEPFRAMTVDVLPWAILAGAFRSLRIHFGQHVFLLREETRFALATDVVDGVATMIGGAIGLAVSGLVGCVFGAACGAGLGLAATLVWGAYRHGFLFPLIDFVKICGAALVMVFALSFVSIEPRTLSIASAIALGAAVYGASMSVLYPDRTRSFWDKIRSFSRA